jgi:hypothetical protein
MLEINTLGNPASPADFQRNRIRGVNQWMERNWGTPALNIF